MAVDFARWLTPKRKNNLDDGKFIQLQGLTKHYIGLSGEVWALKGIDLSVRRGEFLVITGKSGAGKTTLVNMIAGLDSPTGGEIWVNGTAVHRLSADQAAAWRGRTVGVVFQTFELIPTLTVLQNVTLAMDFAGKYSLQDRKEVALALLSELDIAEHSGKRPWAVSGGQQQRVAIARAMANDPPIIMADEPTGSLDSQTADVVLKAFEDLVERGKTVILVTHDRDITRRASRAIMLADGEIVDMH